MTLTAEKAATPLGASVLWRNRWERLPPSLRGAVWVLSSALLFSLMGAMAKTIGSRLDSFQVAFFRALFGFVFILPFVLHAGLHGLRSEHLTLHLIRGLFGGAAIMCGFYAMIHLPLADATALSFARALFLVPLAALFLGEQIGARRTLAALVGFAGVILMTRPTGEFHFATLIALLSAALVACVVIFVKQLSHADKPATLIFYSSAIAALMTSIPAILVWTQPTPFEWLQLITMSLFGVMAQSCFIRGYALAEAAALAPLEYTRLLFAVAAGFMFFGDVPDSWTLGGATLIICSSVYIAHRESWQDTLRTK